MLTFNNFRSVKFLDLYKTTGLCESLYLTQYLIILKLLFSKFNLNYKVIRFIGVFYTKKSKKNVYLPTKGVKRYKFSKGLLVRKKFPYFFSNLSTTSKYLKIASRLNLYKSIWSNNDVFEITNTSAAKRYSTFNSKNRMLSGILRQSIAKTFKKSINRYAYRKVAYGNSFKSTTGLLDLGMSSSFDKKNKKLRPIFFKKRFYKTLIGGRQLLKDLLKCRSKNKKGVINLISTHAHTTFTNRLLRFELSLFNVILKSRFTTSIRDSFFWVNSGAAFINGVASTNPYKQVSLNDRLQLPISNKYFFYKKVQTIRNTRDIAKLKSKVYLKNRGHFNLFRKRSNLWPTWTLRTAFFRATVPNFLEVDYMTLTSVVLYLPRNILEFDSVIWKFINIYNYRLYN